MDTNGREELGFGVIRNSANNLNSNRYVLFHTIFRDSAFFKTLIMKDISYDKFSGYLLGVSLGKDDKSFHLYNKIADCMKQEYFSDLNLSCLDSNELEKLIKDIKLSENFADQLRKHNN